MSDQDSRPISGAWRQFQVRFALKAWDLAIVLLVAFLVGGYVVARGSHANAGPLGRPLRVGIVSWPGYAGGLVANNGMHPNRDSDFWRNQKLLVAFELIADEQQLHSAFERGGDNGGVDVMWSTVDSLAQQLPAFLKRGVHPVAFMQVDWSRGGDAIVASKGIERIEDLKGKRIAVSMSASLWLLEYNLSKSSLTPDDIKHIKLTRTKGSPEALELFLDRHVDAAVLWEPDVSKARERSGDLNVVVSTSTAGQLIADVMVAKREFIEQNTPKIVAFVRGWLEDGTRKATENPLRAVWALQQEKDFARLSEEKTRELLDKTALATMNDNIGMFGLAGGVPFFDRLFSEASQLWLGRGYLVSTAKASQARATNVLEEIYNAPSPSAGCGPVLLTEPLEVPFVARSAELSPEARTILDKNWLLLRTYSNARFCIEVDMEREEGNSNLRATREKAVIEYLMWHCNCATSRFVSSTDAAADEPSVFKSPKAIRLKVINKLGGRK